MEMGDNDHHEADQYAEALKKALGTPAQAEKKLAELEELRLRDARVRWLKRTVSSALAWIVAIGAAFAMLREELGGIIEWLFGER